MAINTMRPIVQVRKDRVALERQAMTLFRTLLKAERGRAGLGAIAMSPAGRAVMARRVRTIDSEIQKIRRTIRKMGIGARR